MIAIIIYILVKTLVIISIFLLQVRCTPPPFHYFTANALHTPRAARHYYYTGPTKMQSAKKTYKNVGCLDPPQFCPYKNIGILTYYTTNTIKT
jgi:hypothetical protein